MNGLFRHVKALLGRALEIGCVVAVVLLCFAGLLGLLHALFPVGPGLKELISRDVEPVAKPRLERRVVGSGKEVEQQPPVPVAALLSTVRNTVKSKPAESIAWGAARAGMDLYNRDAVQTLSDASAVIAFGEGTSLTLGQNSLVVLREMEQDPILSQRRAAVVVVEGELYGRVSAGGSAKSQLEVTTPNAVTRIPPEADRGRGADFKISVNPDRSSTVTVFQGVAEVVGQGQVVRVAADQSTTVRASGAVQPSRPLPTAPLSTGPEESREFTYRDLPPQVRFSWQRAGDATSFRFLLARDAQFRDVVVDEILDDNEFTHGNLAAGGYHWRVAGVDGWAMGSFGESRSLYLVQDVDPPELRVGFPPEQVLGNLASVHGTVEPGCRVFVAGEPMAVAETGEFAHALELRPGINVIVVEAVDGAGNISYSSRRVNAKF